MKKTRKSYVNFKIEGKVTHISDGDTLKIKGKNKAEFKIRFSDIDTPETEQEEFIPHKCKCKTIPFRHGQTGGMEATNALKEIIKKGDVVTAECYELGKYGRMICHIFKGKTNVNLEMIKTGWGWLSKKYPIRDSQGYKEEEIAKNKKLGAWGIEGQIHPSDWRTNCWKNGQCSGAK